MKKKLARARLRPRSQRRKFLAAESGVSTLNGSHLNLNVGVFTVFVNLYILVRSAEGFCALKHANVNRRGASECSKLNSCVCVLLFSSCCECKSKVESADLCN